MKVWIWSCDALNKRDFKYCPVMNKSHYIIIDGCNYHKAFAKLIVHLRYDNSKWFDCQESASYPGEWEHTAATF